jgi:hypothetical protein
MTIAAASVGLAALSAGAGVYSQYQGAKSQNKMFEANARSANESAQIESEALAARQQQEREAAGQALVQNAMDAASVRGTNRAAAAESGLSGFSIDALINETSMQEARNAETIEANQGFAAQQYQLERRGIAANARSRRNSVSRGSFNPAVAALQIGTAVGGAGLDSYTRLNPKTT